MMAFGRCGVKSRARVFLGEGFGYGSWPARSYVLAVVGRVEGGWSGVRLRLRRCLRWWALWGCVLGNIGEAQGKQRSAFAGGQ